MNQLGVNPRDGIGRQRIVAVMVSLLFLLPASAVAFFDCSKKSAAGGAAWDAECMHKDPVSPGTGAAEELFGPLPAEIPPSHSFEQKSVPPKKDLSDSADRCAAAYSKFKAVNLLREITVGPDGWTFSLNLTKILNDVKGTCSKAGREDLSRQAEGPAVIEDFEKGSRELKCIRAELKAGAQALKQLIIPDVIGSKKIEIKTLQEEAIPICQEFPEKMSSIKERIKILKLELSLDNKSTQETHTSNTAALNEKTNGNIQECCLIMTDKYAGMSCKLGYVYWNDFTVKHDSNCPKDFSFSYIDPETNRVEGPYAVAIGEPFRQSSCGSAIKKAWIVN